MCVFLLTCLPEDIYDFLMTLSDPCWHSFSVRASPLFRVKPVIGVIGGLESRSCSWYV